MSLKNKSWVVDVDLFKADCDWRKKGFCNLVQDQCQPKPKKKNSKIDHCALFDLPFEKKAIEQRIKDEHSKLREYIAELKELKKTKGDKERLKFVEFKIADKGCGIKLLSRAYDDLHGGLFSKLAIKNPRIKKLMEKIK